MSMDPIPIAIAGLGKIARGRHVPSILASGEFRLAGIASPQETLDGVPSFPSLDALLDAVPGIAAVSVCTPPQVRREVARRALERGLSVLLEKPPGVTVAEAESLAALAHARGASLFASWHSRYGAAVEPARAWLATRRILGGRVAWKEDVRVWHPGQAWIWKEGGLGVFDPGINALSILTLLAPAGLGVENAELRYPGNCGAPSAAKVRLHAAGGGTIDMELDFLQTGPPTWSIALDTDRGRLLLSRGGRELELDGRSIEVAPASEYAALYAHFAALLRRGASDVDLRPFALVAEVFARGKRLEGPPFHE
jgi:D-galactose 1-dehydrogenase